MGFISDILNTILGESSSDPKQTSVSESDGEIRVRNSDVVVDHETGKHDTIWSNTTVNVNTGQTSSSEGTHGPNFQK